MWSQSYRKYMLADKLFNPFFCIEILESPLREIRTMILLPHTLKKNLCYLPEIFLCPLSQKGGLSEVIIVMYHCSELRKVSEFSNVYSEIVLLKLYHAFK